MPPLESSRKVLFSISLFKIYFCCAIMYLTYHIDTILTYHKFTIIVTYIQVSKDSAISMSPISSGGSSRHSPVSPNNEKDLLTETLQNETKNRTVKNENREVHPNFQFCTLPRKKKSCNGGKLCFI